MNRRPNCYLNSAYNRNVDDFDDYLEEESQLSFDSRRHSYESENETYVDEFLDNNDSYNSENNRLATFNHNQIDNRSYNMQQLCRHHYDTFPINTSAKCQNFTDRLTSTPKKQKQQQQQQQLRQCTTPSSLKNPRRRTAIARRRSFSALSRYDTVNDFVDNNYQSVDIKRSKSSLSLRQPKFEYQRYSNVQSAPVHFKNVGCENNTERNHIIHNITEPALRLPNISSVTPFQIRQKTADIFTVRNSFLRRPYDFNSSFSSSKPLVSRNTAVISPIYTKKSMPSSFDVDRSREFTVSMTDRSTSSSKMSWLQIRKQNLPLWTLRTCAITLLICGTLSCLLCIHIISQRGKSYELTFSLISGFIILCLGFPCLRFQEWQWLPNRNYVTGYILLSIFSLLQTIVLWILDKYPDLRQDIIDIMKGALCGLSSLSLSIALLGVCTSCCCKYPPPDNRVTHEVQGFTV
ncbi:hypothetical protein PGB90_002876 [Kerria lacca]